MSIIETRTYTQIEISTSPSMLFAFYYSHLNAMWRCMALSLMMDWFTWFIHFLYIPPCTSSRALDEGTIEVQKMNKSPSVLQHLRSMSYLSVPAICQTPVRAAKLTWTRLSRILHINIDHAMSLYSTGTLVSLLRSKNLHAFWACYSFRG